MIDPTYDTEKINANPKWKAAFILSEIYNDEAPIRWSKYLYALDEMERQGLEVRFRK